MLPNATRLKLAEGRPVFGCFFRYPEASLAEYVAMLGWDFLAFDAEHSTLQPRDVESLCRAVESRGVTPIVRVPVNQPDVILRFLDVGAQGIHVPSVNSPEEVELAVRAVKYAPRGERGLAATRVAEWALREPLSTYVQNANRETMVIVHVETREAVEAIEDYVTVDGVDVLFLGPMDLSQSLGHPGEPGHPDVVAAMERVAEVVTRSDKVLGIYAGTPSMTEAWLTRGARYFTTGLEAFLRDGMTGHLQQLRGSGQ